MHNEMALTNAQLLQRIVILEEALEELTASMNNLVTKKTANAAIALKQQEIDALKERVTNLESQIAILQSE
jgi:polyhydroxyalkanoate synthesis regulator phasin